MAHQALAEGIAVVLSQWTALELAVQNEWGGRDARHKVQDLSNSILDWFTQSKEVLYIDDLENMLDESMLLLFSTEIEDGSIEEVAEQLMILQEECLQGKSDLITKLRASTPASNAVSQSRQVVCENKDISSDDEDISSDNEISDMLVDEPKPEASLTSQQSRTLRDAEGWSVVAPRKGRGKR